LRSGATPYNASHLEERMRPIRRHEVLESVYVEMDPVLDGFCGVLVELLGVGEGYVLVETAVGTGNRLLRFASESPDLAYAAFESELGSPG
jgi:hypothetical protein